MVLGDVEETVYIVDDEAQDDDEVRTVNKKSEMLFVRGMDLMLGSRGKYSRAMANTQQGTLSF